MSTRSNIIVKVKKEDYGRVLTKTFKRHKYTTTIEKPYIGIYCHWDGYIEGVGRELLEHYNTYEKALKLISGGFASSIDGKKVSYYMAWDRDEEWSQNCPRQSDKLEVCGGWTEYAYIFDNGKWYVGRVKWHEEDDSETIEDVVELTMEMVKEAEKTWTE